MLDSAIPGDLVIAAGHKKKEKAYWLKKLAGELQKTFFPYDTWEFVPGKFKPASFTFPFHEEIASRLLTMSKENDARLHMILTAGLLILLKKYTGAHDIIIGTPIYRQENREADGPLINRVLILRNQLKEGITFKDLLIQVGKNMLEAVENQNYPLEILLQQLGVTSSDSEYPLFAVGIILDNIQDLAYIDFLNLDILFSFKRTRQSIEGQVLYNGLLYREATIKQIIRHCIHLFREVLFNVEISPQRIGILSPEEKKQLLDDFNHEGMEYPVDKTVHQLFAQQVEKTPDRIALIGIGHGEGEGKQEEYLALTYKTLSKKVLQLSCMLGKKGVNAGTIVAVMLNRSVEMINALLAILKAGGAYLPIEPNYPRERIHYMLTDSNAGILLTTPDLSGKITFLGKILHLTGAINCDPTPPPAAVTTSLAYVIYTSGTTGKPKGVMVEHASAVNVLTALQERYPLMDRDIYLFKTSVTFDVSVTELFGWFFGEGRLVLLEKGAEKSPGKILDTIAAEGVTHINFVPSMFNAFLDTLTSRDSNKLSCLKYIFLAGEALLPEVVTRFRNLNTDISLENIYGPTEGTVYSSWYSLDKWSGSGNIPIGKPLPNIRLYILDQHKHLQPISIPGELYISGVGLARGYINQPELTAEKFAHDSGDLWDFRDKKIKKRKKGPGKRIYNMSSRSYRSHIFKTGDLGRWLADGNIEFLGRIDYQVKIRGFRIELGEIESRLLKHQEINDAVVIAREDENRHKQLYAFITAAQNTNFELGKLRQFLAKELPDYMIPAYFVPVETIPLTANGKVDRKVLDRLAQEKKITGQVVYETPFTEIQEKLLAVWQEVLRMDNLGINHNFFQVGGDSIKAIQVSNRLLKFKLKLDVEDLLLNQTIKKLEPYIKSTGHVIEQGTAVGDVPLTPIQKWFFENHSQNPHHFNQAVMLYREQGFDEQSIEKVFTKIVMHHDALRIIYKIEGTQPLQRNQGTGKSADMFFNLEIFNLKGIKDVNRQIQREADRIQKSINLLTGPLVKLGLFKTDLGDHLLMVIHHLVVDGISWRILLEDFALGYRQEEKMEPVVFQEKTDSFKYWAEQLCEYAASQTTLNELSYWQEVEETEVENIPVDQHIPLDQQINKNCQMIHLSMDENQTSTLLKEIHWVYNTTTLDILLAALGIAVHRWAGIKKILINLEGHGRESISTEVDINVNRTVGWFTSQYPVLLDMTHVDDTGYTIKFTKESIRRIPNKGIGYGILKYLTPPDKIEGVVIDSKPGISFNFMGEFGQENQHPDPLFTISEIETGNNVSPLLRRNHLLDINGMVKEGRLSLSFTYCKGQFKRSTIERLIETYKTSLLNILEHCARKTEKELTPSDVGYNKVSIHQLQQINRLIPRDLEIQCIYPLTPIQNGMLFHALKDEESYSYFEQLVLVIKGELQESLIEESFTRLFHHCDILRSSVVHKGLEEPLQVVFKKRNPHIYIKDISHLEENSKAHWVEKFKEKEKKRGFNLTKDLLMRIALLKTAGDSWTMVWSFHHILMDGWCLGIIFKYLVQIYQSLRKGQQLKLEPIPPLKRYIQWLDKKNKQQDLAYWQDYLKGYEKQVVVMKFKKPLPGYRYEPGEYHFTLDEVQTRGLIKVAGENQVTVNTVFQTAWGVLLQRYNNTDDVVFGVVVSGRPPEILGIEHMVGLFINTIPVRIQTKGQQPFSQVLLQTQRQAALVKPYEYLPLAEIQAKSPLKGSLIDHVISFENYPLQEEVKAVNDSSALGFHVRLQELFEQANYDFAILIMPGKLYNINIHFNAIFYKTDAIKNVAQNFMEILKQVIENPGIPVKDINIQHELLVAESKTSREEYTDFEL